MFIVKTSPDGVVWLLLAQDENRPQHAASCCLGWLRPVVFVNPLLIITVGFRRFKWLSAASVFDCLLRFGGIFSSGFGVPVKPRVHRVIALAPEAKSAPVGRIRGGGSARRKGLAWV